MISVLNPVTDVIKITSLADKELSNVKDELGSLAERRAREQGKLRRLQ